MSTVAYFVKQLREQFYGVLDTKTGWGKEELKLAFERAVSNALAEAVDNENEA